MFKVTFTRPGVAEPIAVFHTSFDDALYTAETVRDIFNVPADVQASDGEPWQPVHRARIVRPTLAFR